MDTSGPVSIEVVREDGRWFVSPVTTALDLLDSTIEHIDQRTVYTLLGLAYELPPDGTITLDQPFQVPATAESILKAVSTRSRAAAGQEVIGEMSPWEGGNETYAYAYGRVYTTDGEEIGSVDFQPIPDRTGSAGLLRRTVCVAEDRELPPRARTVRRRRIARRSRCGTSADAPRSCKVGSAPHDLSSGIAL